MENVVHCNILHSIKATFFELEKAVSTVATLVLVFAIISPGPYIHSKQSKTYHAERNLEVNCERNVFYN